MRNECTISGWRSHDKYEIRDVYDSNKDPWFWPTLILVGTYLKTLNSYGYMKTYRRTFFYKACFNFNHRIYILHGILSGITSLAPKQTSLIAYSNCIKLMVSHIRRPQEVHMFYYYIIRAFAFLKNTWSKSVRRAIRHFQLLYTILSNPHGEKNKHLLVIVLKIIEKGLK